MQFINAIIIVRVMVDMYICIYIDCVLYEIGNTDVGCALKYTMLLQMHTRRPCGSTLLRALTMSNLMQRSSVFTVFVKKQCFARPIMLCEHLLVFSYI